MTGRYRNYPFTGGMNNNLWPARNSRTDVVHYRKSNMPLQSTIRSPHPVLGNSNFLKTRASRSMPMNYFPSGPFTRIPKRDPKLYDISKILLPRKSRSMPYFGKHRYSRSMPKPRLNGALSSLVNNSKSFNNLSGDLLKHVQAQSKSGTFKNIWNVIKNIFRRKSGTGMMRYTRKAGYRGRRHQKRRSTRRFKRR